jgi:hypothetical protein
MMQGDLKMALIEKWFVIADHYPVAVGEEIIEGMMVKLDPNGNLILATGAGGEVCLGVSADTKSTSLSGLPSTNPAYIGAPANSQQLVNRVSDMYDETKASGRLTVYHAGGVFASNQFEAAPYNVNDPLYVSVNGKLTTVPPASAQIVGRVVKVPGPYSSGVPGIDIDGSISLGSYLEYNQVI